MFDYQAKCFILNDQTWKHQPSLMPQFSLLQNKENSYSLGNGDT